MERPGHSSYMQRELVEKYLQYGTIERVFEMYPDFDYLPKSYELFLRKRGIVVFPSKNPRPLSQSEDSFREILDHGNPLSRIIKKPMRQRERAVKAFSNRLIATLRGRSLYNATCLLFYNPENPDEVLIGEDISTETAPLVPPVSYTANEKNAFISCLYVAQQEAFTELALIGDIGKNNARAKLLIPENPFRIGQMLLFDALLQMYAIPLSPDFYVDRSSFRLQKLHYSSASTIAQSNVLDKQYRLGVVEIMKFYTGEITPGEKPHTSAVNLQLQHMYHRS